MKNKICVLYILHSSSKYEGSNKSLLCMLEGLIQLGVKPFIVMPETEEMSLCNKFVELNVRYKTLQYRLPVYSAALNLKDRLLFIPRLIKNSLLEFFATIQVIFISKYNQADLIHTNVGPLLIGDKASSYLGIPHIWHLREYQHLGFNWKPFYSLRSFKKKLKRKRNYPIAISQGIFDHFNLNRPAQVIYNGILKASDAQFFTEKEKYFLFVGYLKEEKGIRSLLMGFAKFLESNNDYKLYVVGDTHDQKYKTDLVSLIKKEGITDHVQLLGIRDDVPNLMAKATAIIVPSVYEGFGRITAEAMFNGCLVIGRNATGTKEILEKEKLGLLYNNQSELIKFLQLVSSEGIEKFFPIIKKAQEVALHLFSQEQNVKQVYQYYQAVLQRANRMKYNNQS